MKYLIVLTLFLVGCTKDRTLMEIAGEVRYELAFKENCGAIAKVARMDYKTELSMEYGKVHHLCNLFSHKRHIFNSFAPIEVDAIIIYLASLERLK